MSGYDKTEDYAYDEYEQNTRSAQATNYPGYAQPSPSFNTPTSYTPSSQAPEPIHHGLPLTPAPIPLISASVPTYVPRDSGPLESPATASYQEPRGLSSFPTIISTGPFQGNAGETLRILLHWDVRQPLEKYTLSVNFGEYQSCKGVLKGDYWQDQKFCQTLEVEIPDLGVNSNAMPLMLDIHDENLGLVHQKSIGHFQYGSSGYQPYPSAGGKRKFSEDSPEFFGSQSKRSASQPLQPSKYKDSSSAYSGHPIPIPSVSNYSSNHLYTLPSYERSSLSHSSRTYSTYSGARSPYGYSMNPSSVPQNIKARSPARSQYRSLTNSQSPRVLNQQANSTEIGRSLVASAPPLVRTSMNNRQSSLSTTTYPPVNPSFNPYAIYPNAKATLTVHGDLQSMCQGWTTAEKAAKRRLVEFQRTQIGSTIEATFKAVTPEERSPNNPCISCIYWEKKSEFFCTSVDTIALLEALVNVRFTVEEKNRIRRNLEGYKPYTVSKSKDECDDIFRLIMGFPNPKPRNIEKDIKIFTWHHLGMALKKIIGKYSASYSSTSSVMTPPSSGPGGYGGTISDASDLPLPTASGTRSGLSLSYPSMTSRALSPAGMSGPSAGLDDLRASAMHHHGTHMLSASATPSHMSHQQWQPTGYPQHYTTGPTALPHPHASRSWDMPSYLEQQQSAASGASSGQLNPYHHRSMKIDHPEDGADQDDPQQQQPTSSYAAQHHHHQHHHHQPTSRP